jgi:hypothetical protein
MNLYKSTTYEIFSDEFKSGAEVLQRDSGSSSACRSQAKENPLKAG